MIEKEISYICNYLWDESMNNVTTILSSDETNNFNLNDYFYLTKIYSLGTPNFGEVAKELNLTKPAISALVNRLSKNGLIQKIQNEEDKRVYNLIITEKGKQIIEGDNLLYSQLAKVIESLAPENQLKDVKKLLENVVNILKNK
ncbi:MAG: MarR family transcriptional regulator [Clostridiaceae bacterium]